MALGVVLAAGVGVALTMGGAPGSAMVRPFSLPRLGPGPPVSVPLVGEGAHRPVVLTFFASWCTVCHGELPAVARVAQRAREDRDAVRFVGVDGNDAPASGLAFARRSGVEFPVGSDGDSVIAPTEFGVDGYPATVFISRAGDVVSTVRGAISVAALQAGIARLDRG